MKSSMSICAACASAADAGKLGEKVHIEAGCTGKERCGCQHRAEGRYLPGYPKPRVTGRFETLDGRPVKASIVVGSTSSPSSATADS